MYCHLCGKHMPDESIFCSKCGTKLHHVDDEKENNSEPNESEQVQDEDNDEDLDANTTPDEPEIAESPVEETALDETNDINEHEEDNDIEIKEEQDTEAKDKEDNPPLPDTFKEIPSDINNTLEENADEWDNHDQEQIEVDRGDDPLLDKIDVDVYSDHDEKEDNVEADLDEDEDQDGMTETLEFEQEFENENDNRTDEEIEKEQDDESDPFHEDETETKTEDASEQKIEFEPKQDERETEMIEQPENQEYAIPEQVEPSETIHSNQSTEFIECPEGDSNGEDPHYEIQSRTESTDNKSRHLGWVLPVFIPIVSLLLIVSGLIYFFHYESNINNRVLELQHLAEEEALARNYQTAIHHLETALALRPNYTVLNDNLVEIERANELATKIKHVSELNNISSYSEAETKLTEVNDKVQKETGPLFSPLHHEVVIEQHRITVGNIAMELEELTTINELAERLSIVRSTPTEKQEELTEQILDKIVDVSLENAHASLENNHFSDAITTINRGLVLAVDDKSLLALKDHIEETQLSFEKAEQERIEAAIEAAAQEDHKNRTEAVHVTAFTTELDENWNLYIYGEMTNVATTEIHNVQINYSIYDNEGFYVGSGLAMVTPHYLNPGEAGYFEDFYYFHDVFEKITVEIDSITWNLY